MMVRNWRERWAAGAEFEFARRLKMGDGMVVPGDRVTPEMREKLGNHRLRRWWEGGFIRIATEKATEPTVGNIRDVASHKIPTFTELMEGSDEFAMSHTENDPED
jgi:hypothetical protein